MTRSHRVVEVGPDLLEQMLAQGPWAGRRLLDLRTIAAIEGPGPGMP